MTDSRGDSTQSAVPVGTCYAVNYVTGNTLAWHNPNGEGMRKDVVMSDEQERKLDTKGRPIPSFDEVLNVWLTVEQALTLTRFTTRQGLRDAVKAGRIAGYKFGGNRRGEWRIDPDSLEYYLSNEDD